MLSLIALLASTGTSQPTCAMTVHPAEDSCPLQSRGPTELLAAADAGDDSPANDCCGNGCPDCGLPCCTGVASILPAAPVAGSTGCVRTRPLVPTGGLVPGDPLAIDHPPRI